MISFLITSGALIFGVFCAAAGRDIYKDRVKRLRRLAEINTGKNQ